MPRKIKHYGWKPDLPDHRDHMYQAPPSALLPSSVDLTRWAVYDQGDLGSCTANEGAGIVQFNRTKQGLTPDFIPSRLMIYWNERYLEGTTSFDSGATIRDSMKALATWGACPESEWPYNIADYLDKPTAQCFTDGYQYRIGEYLRLRQKTSEMKTCLANGYPFVFGFSVYESFESDAVAKTGVVPMPSHNEALLGGHAVMCSGYDEFTQRFVCRNSWGSNWGLNGYFTIPYDYLNSRGLSADFWTVRNVLG